MSKYKLTQKTDANGTTQDIQLDASCVDLSGYVPTSRTINSKALSSNITLAAADVKALPNYSLSISTNSGNPREVKFVRVNYSTFDGNNAAYFKIGAMCSHGNGSSYTFLEDIIIGVSATPSVTCTIYKQVQNASTYTIDSHSVHFGDVYWVVDTTNKYVDFYIIGGQYATLMFTPFMRIGNTVSDTSKIVQYTSANYYSSGTRVWDATGNSSLYARLSDIPSASVTSVNGQTGAVTLSIPTKTSDLTNDSGFITSSSLSGYYPKSGGALNSGAVITMTGSNPYVGLQETGGTQYYLQGYQGELGISVSGNWGTKRLSIDSNGKVFIPSKSLGDGTYTYTLPSKTGTIALTSDIPDTSSFALASEHPIKLTLVATCNSTNTYGVSLYGKFTAGKWYLIVPIITVNTSDYYMKLGTSNSVKYMGDNPLVCRAGDANTLNVAWFNPSTSSTGSASVKYGNYCCIYQIN